MKILVAIDGSEHSRLVVEAVASRLWEPGSTIKLVTVIDTSSLIHPSSDADSEAMPVQQELEAIAYNLAQQMPNVSIEPEVHQGLAKEVLLQLASDWSCDLIIVGSHGQSGLGALLLGSVSQVLLQNAMCPVLVVKSTIVGLNKQQSNVLVLMDGLTSSRMTMEWLMKQRWQVPVNVHLQFFMSHSGKSKTKATTKDGAKSAKADVLTLLQEYSLQLQNTGVVNNMTYDIVEGKSPDAVLATAKQWPAHLIMIGSHGKIGLTKLLGKSVLSVAVFHSQATVEVVRYMDLTDYIEEQSRIDKRNSTAADLYDYKPHNQVF